MPPEPQVLVVGGGPAGSTVAGLLARRGMHVLLVDRAAFPRAKPCGECLNPGAVALLEELGLLDAVMELGPAVLRGWDLRTDRGAAATGRFPLRASFGLGVSRERLDATLLETCGRAGVQVQTRVRVEGVVPGGPGFRPTVVARTARGRRLSWRPDLVIGADGLRSVVARSIGAASGPARLRKVSLTCHVRVPAVLRERDRGTLFLGREGTVGLAPLGGADGLWNATVVLDPRRYGRALARSPLSVFRARVAAAAPDWPGIEVVAGPWASGPFHRPVCRAWAPGVLLVGDAAGYYDPLTGQGIYRALRSAQLAATAAGDALRGDPDAPATYGTRIRSAFAWPRRVQRGVEAVVSSRLLDPALALLGWRPAVADTLVGVTGDLLPVRALARPAPWFARGWKLGA